MELDILITATLWTVAYIHEIRKVSVKFMRRLRWRWISTILRSSIIR